MKLEIYSKEKKSAMMACSVGVRLAGVELPHLVSLKLELAAKQVNRCEAVFLVDEVDVSDLDVEALLQHTEAGLTKELSLEEARGQNITISNSMLVALIKKAREEGAKEALEKTEACKSA